MNIIKSITLHTDLCRLMSYLLLVFSGFPCSDYKYEPPPHLFFLFYLLITDHVQTDLVPQFKPTFLDIQIYRLKLMYIVLDSLLALTISTLYIVLWNIKLRTYQHKHILFFTPANGSGISWNSSQYNVPNPASQAVKPANTTSADYFSQAIMKITR